MRIVVIGSGLLGVTSAYFLAKDGAQVTVVDRADGIAKGTSFANAGMLTPSMADPWNSPGVFWHLVHDLGRENAPMLLRPRALPSIVGWGLRFLAHSRPEKFRASMRANLRLADYSLQVLRELRVSLGLRYDETTAGTLKIFRNARKFDETAERLGFLQALGLRVQRLTPAQVLALEPALGEVGGSLVGGLHCLGDESGDARLFTEALAQKAREAGVEFRFDSAVEGFDLDGNCITAVVTSRAKLDADRVVVAAGSWSPRVLASLGIQLPVRPVKGYSITLQTGAWSAGPRLPVVDDSLHAAITPLGRRLRVAGTAEFAGYDLSLPPARVENLYGLLLGVFPSFAPHLDRGDAAPWAGLRPMTPSGVPLIGRLKFRNLYVNTGHGHLGWTMAAGSARLLADQVFGRPPAIDPTPYDAQRR